jgi:hypothetical protein
MTLLYLSATMITNSIVEQDMFYIFPKINWSDMMGEGGGVYSGLVYHDPIRVEMHKSQLVNTAQSVLTMRLQRCLSWSSTLQDNDNNQNG